MRSVFELLPTAAPDEPELFCEFPQRLKGFDSPHSDRLAGKLGEYIDRAGREDVVLGDEFDPVAVGDDVSRERPAAFVYVSLSPGAAVSTG